MSDTERRPEPSLDDAIDNALTDIAMMQHGIALIFQEMPPEREHSRLWFLVDALDLMRTRAEAALSDAFAAYSREHGKPEGRV